MAEIDFLSPLHTSTKRDYIARVTEHDKAACAEIAKKWGFDYWDGDRRYGYGGYRYDRRWRPVAESMAARYGLKAGNRVLDVGCGKGHLLYELTQVVPGIEIAGIDVSEYGIANAKEEIRSFLRVGDAVKLPWPDRHFDFVFSINTFHNLCVDRLDSALRELQRVGRRHRYICVESYRNEREKMNLLYWQLTCEAFLAPKGWRWMFEQSGYEGDYGFIFFE